MVKLMKRTGWICGWFLIAAIGQGVDDDGPCGFRDLHAARRGGAGGACGGHRPRRAPRRGQRGGRGGRDGVRPGGDAPRGGQPGRRRLHRRLPGRSQGGGDGRFPGDRPAAVEPADVPGAGGKLRPRYRTGAWAAGVPGTVRGLALAHARWGKRPWAELVRPAARLAREGFPISGDLAGSLNRQLTADRRSGETRRDGARTDFGRSGRLPRVGRRIRQARRLPLAGRRPARPGRPGRHPGPDRHEGSGRVLHGPDRPAHRGLHGRARRLHHARRPEVLRGQAPAAGPYDVSRPRRLQHRPLIERGRRPLPDAQHPRAVRPQGGRPGLATDASTASPRRCDAPTSPGPPGSPTPTSSDIPVAELTSKVLRR